MGIVFLDTNVFLDALLQWSDDFAYCQMILNMKEASHLEIKTSSSSLLNVMYFLSKAGMDKPAIIKLTTDLLKIIALSETNEKIFMMALHAGFQDLEDAVQYYTALNTKGIDYFITSNTRDYKKASAQLPVISPKQFIKKAGM